MGAELRADPEGPCMVAGKRKGAGAEPGLGAKRHLGEPTQALPSTLQSLCLCPGAERRKEHARNGPQPTLGSHPAVAQLGTKTLLLSQQTPLCPTSRRRGPRHRLTLPLPEAPELLLSYLGERGPAGGENEGR